MPSPFLCLLVALPVALGPAPRAACGDPPPSPPPPQARALFDGTDTRSWRRWDPAAAASGIGKAPVGWRVEDGALVADPGAAELVSAESFADYHLHLDFLLSPGTSELGGGTAAGGDGRGVGGVFLAGRYEVLLADASGAESGSVDRYSKVTGSSTRGGP
jgi:hypothetical protein